MPAPKPVRKMPTTSPDAPAEARAQAEAYNSLFSPREIDLDDGSTISIPPHPDFGMLDDENMEAYEELLFEMESYDREDDIFIPEQRLRDDKGNETGVVLPADTQRGELKRPFRRTVDGKTELVETAAFDPGRTGRPGGRRIQTVA